MSHHLDLLSVTATVFLLTTHWLKPRNILDLERGHKASYCQALLHPKVLDEVNVVTFPATEKQLVLWVGRIVSKVQCALLYF